MTMVTAYLVLNFYILNKPISHFPGIKDSRSKIILVSVGVMLFALYKITCMLIYDCLFI